MEWLSQDDHNQLKSKGMTVEQVARQIGYFQSGFPFIRLDRPATAGDGILQPGGERTMSLIQTFDNQLNNIRVVKFVPASGAASRMFKHLFEFQDGLSAEKQSNKDLNENLNFNSADYLLYHLREIAFYESLATIAEKVGTPVASLMASGNYRQLIDLLLSSPGLNYANLPKALIQFHSYPEGSRTAAEEHLVEASVYARDKEGVARIHFTISPEHREKFLELLNRVQAYHEARLGVRFDISFSVQKPSTDIIAVDPDNVPVRNSDGSLLFRPGGHGALLANLADIEADIIFIKNIDNVVPDHLRETTYLYKKVIGGLLLEIVSGIRSRLKLLAEEDQGGANADLAEIARYVTKELGLSLPGDYSGLSRSDKADALRYLMNRPVRVCGMVKNEGEPGGGPFWVKDNQGQCSLQVVESSQVDMKDPVQRGILESSTHFNPVDLVCCTRDYRGNRFNLFDYVDEETGFISSKSSGGKSLKAQELPGLWNGSMARWITLFVEVPILTFNPVKTVNDLLRAEHLPARS